MMRSLLGLFLLILIGCGSPLRISPPHLETTTTFSRENSKEWFKIIVLDVGQGDATLLISPEGQAALIDTGPAGRGDTTILSVLDELGIEKIEKIFISHPHEDHIGGLTKLLQNNIATQVIDKNSAQVGSSISLGEVQISIKAANGYIANKAISDIADDENNLSLALLVTYHQFRYFTDGDLPGGGGEPPYQTIDFETPLAPSIGDVDILLVPHHGSHTSTNEIFLSTLKPEVAIISVGDDNDYFHPHPSVIERLKKAGVKIYQTERGKLTNTEGVEIVGGHICVMTDGIEYLIEAYAIDKCTPPT